MHIRQFIIISRGGLDCIRKTSFPTIAHPTHSSPPIPHPIHHQQRSCRFIIRKRCMKIPFPIFQGTERITFALYMLIYHQRRNNTKVKIDRIAKVRKSSGIEIIDCLPTHRPLHFPAPGRGNPNRMHKRGRQFLQCHHSQKGRERTLGRRLVGIAHPVCNTLLSPS